MIAMRHDQMLERNDQSWEAFMPLGHNRDDRLLDALRDMFAEQNKQLNAQGQHLAQQTQRIDGISNQIMALANQQEALRNDFNQRWQDLPKLYVPRQEHQAMALDARTVALEEFRVAATKDLADLKLTTTQQIQQAIQTASQEIANAKMAAQEADVEQRTTLDARQITALVTAITVGASIIVEVVLKIIFH